MKSATDADREGILLVNKPQGRTSFSLVQELRRRLNVRKIGHAGTLDPFATGVMVMLVGRNYTRLSDSLLQQNKEYLATVRLGISTDSYDCDGAIVATNEALIPTHEELMEALCHFQGTVEQIPPMYSAKKVEGKKLYNLARQGITIERKAVTVQMICTLIDYVYPFVKLHVRCSKGTYIRSIAHDLGQILGCGAHLVELCRTRSGPFTLEECVDLSVVTCSELPQKLALHP